MRCMFICMFSSTLSSQCQNFLKNVTVGLYACLVVTGRTCFTCCCFLCVLQEVVRQKVRRQLTKQQKAAQRRRLQKGEANLVTKSRRENQSTIKSSVESASFWGWMGLQRDNLWQHGSCLTTVDWKAVWFLSLDTHESWERFGKSLCSTFSKFKYGQFNLTKPYES